MKQPYEICTTKHGCVRVTVLADGDRAKFQQTFLPSDCTGRLAIAAEVSRLTGEDEASIIAQLEEAAKKAYASTDDRKATLTGGDVSAQLEVFPPKRKGGNQFQIIVHHDNDLLVSTSASILRERDRQDVTSSIATKLGEKLGATLTNNHALIISVRKHLESMSAEWAREQHAVPATPKIPNTTNELDLATGQEPVGTEWDVCCKLVDRYGDRLRYVRPWKTWLVYNGTRWVKDRDGEVERLTKSVIQGVMSDVPARIGDPKDATRLLRRLRTARTISDTMTLASTERLVAASTSQWDKDPWLLNTLNGTLDLRTSELLPHDPMRFLTKSTSVAYKPDALAPIWEKFLETILPDSDVRRYIQRALGYCLSGDVGEHVLHVLHGIGRNGKSTLMEAVQYLMSDYAAAVPSGLLMSKKNDHHPSEIALLQGLRLAFASETPDGDRMDEAQVKSMTGGDTLTARAMYGDWFSFSPTHKLWLATNHRPHIKGADLGIWRRLRMIPFETVIPADDVDPQLPSKLRSEAEGILAWMVRGAADYWERAELKACAAVVQATGEYREDQDSLSEFIEDCLSFETGEFTSSKDLTRTYLDWAASMGVAERYRIGQRKLVNEMKTRFRDQLVHVKDPARGFRGLRVRTDWRTRTNAGASTNEMGY